MSEEIRDEAADPRIHLSIERTELAWERTHLAWIRTIIVLITSGFAIDSITEAYHQRRIEAGKALISQAHVVSLGMVLTALILLISEYIIYVKRSAELAAMKNQKKKALPNGIILSGIIFCVGVLLIFHMFFTK